MKPALLVLLALLMPLAHGEEGAVEPPANAVEPAPETPDESVTGLQAIPGTLSPLESRYELSRGVIVLGEATFTLSPGEADQCWVYQYRAKPSGLARLFIGNITETSHFCLVDGFIRSQKFSFHRADKEKDNFELEFNWDDRMVRSSIGDMRPLRNDMIDRLAMQVAVKRWVVARGGVPGPEKISMTKVEDDRIKTYSFQVIGHEQVETPAGTFDTVRVERVDDPKKSTRFWLAPDRDYQVVRVEQVRKGAEQLKMLLK